jgi:hypothetical protein
MMVQIDRFARPDARTCLKSAPGDFWSFWSPRKVATGGPLELARRGGPEMIEGKISRPL